MDSGYAIRSIRSTDDWHHVVLRSAEFMKVALDSLMGRYRGDEQDVRQQWYQSEIVPIIEQVES